MQADVDPNEAPSVEFIKWEGVWFDAKTVALAKRGKASQAYAAYKRQVAPKQPIRELRSRLPAGANPSTAACDAFGAEGVSHRLPGGNVLSLCRFDDGSLVSSWALYHGRPPKKISL